MEKHTIDKLFNKQLQDLEQKPSARANELFKQRLAERERTLEQPVLPLGQRKLLYWAAAASLVMAVGIGGLRLWNNTDTTREMAQKQPKQQLEPQINTPAVVREVPSIQKMTAAVGGAHNEGAEKAIAKKRLSYLTSRDEVSNQLVPESAQKTDNPAASANYLAVSPSQSIPTESSTLVAQVASKPVEPLVSTEPPTTIEIATLAEGFPIEENQEPQSTHSLGEASIRDKGKFVTKVFKEIRNLKVGEKVHVAELVKESEQVFAQSETSFFKNEVEEISERWQRIRGIFDTKTGK